MRGAPAVAPVSSRPGASTPSSPTTAAAHLAASASLHLQQRGLVRFKTQHMGGGAL